MANGWSSGLPVPPTRGVSPPWTRSSPCWAGLRRSRPSSTGPCRWSTTSAPSSTCGGTASSAAGPHSTPRTAGWPVGTHHWASASIPQPQPSAPMPRHTLHPCPTPQQPQPHASLRSGVSSSIREIAGVASSPGSIPQSLTWPWAQLPTLLGTLVFRHKGKGCGTEL